LARPADRHLTQEELETLISSSARIGRELPLAGVDPSDVAGHIAECERCRLLVENHASVKARLDALRSRFGDSRGENCPPDEKWLSVVTGLLPMDRTDKYVRHAANCDHCGALLRAATEDLASEPTSEEDSVISTLTSSRGEWQRDMAKRLSALTRNPAPNSGAVIASRKWIPLWPRLTLATAGILVIAFSVFWIFRRESDATANRLLAEAYTQQRTLELRIPGARYAPLRDERAGESSRLNRPPALLEAEALIARKLATHPSDAAWIQARGRAELLDGNSEAAIQSLQRAVEMEPDSASVLIDLATAYFLRGEKQNRPADYGQAIDLLGKALAKKPDDPVALFNRAIASEHIFLFVQAIEDWEHYLRIDSSGEWAAEARQRLANIREKMQKHDQSTNEPFLSPAEILTHDSQSSTQTETVLDRRFEQYLKIATRDWLPVAFPSDDSRIPLTESHAARTALRILARIAQDKHGDVWLADFLSQGNGTKIGNATEMLTRALKASDSGDFSSAQGYASDAVMLFENKKNLAGSLRARLEEVYALHLSEKGSVCARTAAALAPALSDRNYVWLNAQLDLEYAICEGMVGHLDHAQDLTQASLKIAEQSQYNVLFLRGLAAASNNDSSTGNYRLAWKRDVAGLERFWSGDYPPMPGYNIYTDLDTLADNAHQWFLQLAVWKEAIRVLPADADSVLVAMAHSRLANSSLMANEQQLAKLEFAETARLFRLCPQTEATLNNVSEAEIALARLEVLQSNFDPALARLKRVESSLPNISSRYVEINFYQTLGELYSRRGDPQDAERALDVAVALSERGLRFLHSQNDRSTWAHETAPSYRSLVESFFRRGDTEGALELWEWFRGASLRSINTEGEPADDIGKWPSIDSFRHTESTTDTLLPRLDEVVHLSASLTKETVISYVVFSDGVAAWIYDDRGIESRWITVDQKTFQSLATGFSALCADASSDPVALGSDSRELYDLLIAPFSDRLLPRRTLVIESDGPISVIPFQALTDARGNYLIDRVALAWSPGLYLVQSTRPIGSIQAAQSALIVGTYASASEEFQDLQPLPNAIVEAQNIAAKFPSAQILLGGGATPDAVQSFLPQSSIFHFAGHAVSTADDVKLILANGDSTISGNAYLTASSFNADSLRTIQMAVFSACATEKTLEGNFAEPDSLVMTFIHAGVPEVVATRWNVDSASTETFMAKFYGFLVSGLSVAQALRATDIEVRQNSAHTHPFYWSAFNVFGRG
jgi:CHAT domain-containing protein/tetratricopeptide (TPR) repeat protein